MDGGKAGAGVFQQIINQIPPHAVYIEAFLGQGAVLRNKRVAERTIGVELDAQVIAEHWRGDEVPNLEIICGDALALLRSYSWRGDEFVYLDPPYLMATRSTPRPIYRHEFATIEEHRELLSLLRSLPCPIAISGYRSWLYELELAGWRVISYQTVKRSGALGVEHLWMNYRAPLELHDYRFLGGDFRARERIGRMCERWKARLWRMPDLERLLVSAAIEEVRSEIAGQPRAIQEYHSLGSTFRERERVARKCKRWKERLRRMLDMERQALFTAIDEVRSEVAEGPHAAVEQEVHRQI